MRRVEVPAVRVWRWVDGFGDRHGGSTIDVVAGGVGLTGGDGARALLRPLLPWPGPATTSVDALAGLLEHVTLWRRWGVVVARRGGYAVAVVTPDRVEASKVGRRHVQGRTAAGGWSQQRFARRRANQADELVQAVAEHAARLLAPARLDALATGGDRQLVEQVLADHRLRRLADLPRAVPLTVGDPRPADVAALPERLTSVLVYLTDA